MVSQTNKRRSRSNFAFFQAACEGEVFSLLLHFLFFPEQPVRLGASLRYLADTPNPLNLQSPHLKPKPHENNSKFLAVSVLATDFSVLQTVLPALTNLSCILPFFSSCCSLHLAGRVNFFLESAPLPLFSVDDFPFLLAIFFYSEEESFLFFFLDAMFLSTRSSPHLATC